MRKIIAAIPARYDSQRFPGKMLAKLDSLPLIVQTFKSAEKTGLFDKVIVVTDNDEIESEIRKNGGTVIRSKKTHKCGSDRIAEALEKIDVDVVFNIQGDEPFIDKKSIQKLIKCFSSDSVDVATLKQKIIDDKQINSPNVVKVITDKYDNAIYFSRLALPYLRDKKSNTVFWKHVGVYAFRKKSLLKFYKTACTPLENSEQIEAIRFVEIGLKIKVVETSFVGIGIDTKEDLVKAQTLWNKI